MRGQALGGGGDGAEEAQQPPGTSPRSTKPRPVTATATTPVNDRMKVMLSRYHARCRGNHVQYSTTASSKERRVWGEGSGRRRVTDNWQMSMYTVVVMITTGR